MVNMFVDDAYGLAFLVRNRVGDDFQGTVGAVQLANAASVTGMEIILIMFEDQLALEPVEHFQFLAVFRILLGNNLPRMYEVVPGNHESFPEGS